MISTRPVPEAVRNPRQSPSFSLENEPIGTIIGFRTSSRVRNSPVTPRRSNLDRLSVRKSGPKSGVSSFSHARRNCPAQENRTDTGFPKKIELTPDSPRGWLRDDLKRWTERLGGDGGPRVREIVRRTLEHWKADADLAGLRDAAELAKRPEAERDDCRKLWEDVDAPFAKARSGP